MKEITVTELKELFRHGHRPFILDVRQPEEFNESHIEGSHLIPLNELPGRIHELDQTSEIVVSCRSGGRSAHAVAFLMSRGFSKIANLIGGNDAWQRESHRQS